jgi:L-ascorbate metabolism protein UlaG (beta-lactamase superfamily)
MYRLQSLALLMLLCIVTPLVAQQSLQKDTIKTTKGNLVVTFIGHGSLVLQYSGKTIHVDPFGSLTDYSELPDADVILITHHHPDHLDLNAVEKIRTGSTVVIMTAMCAAKIPDGTVMKNGDRRAVGGFDVEAVPAYNLVHKREGGSVFHPKGEGNGYVLTIGKTRLYIAGDTENTPEMKALKNIDYAFLPMNLPYTMTPEMVADAVRGFKPKVLYPYHFGDTDTQKLVDLLKSEKGIVIRLRKMK